MAEPSVHTFNRVRTLIAESANVKRDDVRLDTRLSEDLGLDGDDGDALMIEYAKQFDVDMSSYRFLDHFAWELDPILWGFWLHLWCVTFARTRRAVDDGETWVAPITVAHLVRCAEEKVWRHPYLIPPVATAVIRRRFSLWRHLAALLWRAPFVVFFLAASIGPIATALLKPSFPIGLLMLFLGGIMSWSIVSSIRVARDYYRDRAERGPAPIACAP